MNEEIKNKLENAIKACADKACKAEFAVDALQYTQAAVNASNVIHCLESIAKMEK